MSALALQWGLVLAAVLFGLGLAGLLARRNLVFVLLSIEVMVNAGGLAFVTAGARHGEPDGQVMFLFVLAMAAAEVAIGLALVLELRRRRDTIDADALDRLAEPAGR